MLIHVKYVDSGIQFHYKSNIKKIRQNQKQQMIFYKETNISITLQLICKRRWKHITGTCDRNNYKSS